MPTIAELIDICEERGVDDTVLRKCRIKADYEKALKDLLKTDYDRVLKEFEEKRRQINKRGAAGTDSLARGANSLNVQNRVDVINKNTGGPITPTGGTPQVNPGTYTKEGTSNRDRITIRAVGTPQPPPSKPHPSKTPPSKPHPSKTPPKDSQTDSTMVGNENSLSETERIMAMIRESTASNQEVMSKMKEESASDREKLSESFKVELRGFVDEVRKSRAADEEKHERDRKKLESSVGELRTDLDEIKNGLATRKEFDDLVKRFEDSQTQYLRDSSANNQAVIKKLVEDKDKNQVVIEALQNRIEAMERQFQQYRTYPIQSDNRTNAQIMACQTAFEAVKRNVIIRGIPEGKDDQTDKNNIREELENDFRVVRNSRRDPIKDVQRLGKWYNDQKFPRQVKVVFESARFREEFMREAKEIEEVQKAEWKAWKEAHPDTYSRDHPDKPRYRLYFMDTPNLIRNKKKELIQVCQLLPVAGTSDMDTPVLISLPNGDAKLSLCRRAEDGMWIVVKTGVEANTLATDILRDYAMRRGWKTKSTMAYTSAGAFLPVLSEVQASQDLMGIFNADIYKARQDQTVRLRDVQRAESEVNSALEREMEQQGVLAQGGPRREEDGTGVEKEG